MITLPAVFDRRPWGLVVVHGPDATSFLQALVSQDLAPVAVGATVPSLLLSPKGKLEVMFRATHRAATADGDEWWLDTEPISGAALAASLARFRIRVKAEIDDRTETSALASVIGAELAAPPDGTVAIPTAWNGRPGTDVVGPADAVAVTGFRAGAPDELEALRVDAGIPRTGVDVDESTIPQEAFLEVDAVSFTKGCFLGQELVCRIDSRGHVNRFLRRLDLPEGAVPPPGAEVTHDGVPVGRVTSGADVPDEARVVALAMIRRDVEPGATVAVETARGAVHATVRG